MCHQHHFTCTNIAQKLSQYWKKQTAPLPRYSPSSGSLEFLCVTAETKEATLIKVNKQAKPHGKKQIQQKTKPDEYQKKKKRKKNETKNGKVSLPLKTCSACARVWSNCMQHSSCSTSVHTSIYNMCMSCEHAYTCIRQKHLPLKKILGTHACARKHTCTQLRLFPLKII